MLDHSYVRSVIFCDDLRVENNGKEIAIGIYPGYITIPSMPFVIPHIIIRFELMFTGKAVNLFSVRIVDPAGNSLAEQTGPLTFGDWTLPGTLSIAFEGLIVSTNGDYQILTRVDEEEWAWQRSLAISKIDKSRIRSRADEAIKRLQASATRANA